LEKPARLCNFSLLKPAIFVKFKKEEKMGTRVKPVQPTEIREKKIVYEVIAEIRRKPTEAALKRHKEEEEDLMKLLKK
jgi:hypothetical protein